MRVISGKYRGKLLKEFSLASTKPTLDRVKEAVFSSIQFDIIGAKVLDLFSGTGALGIECISRGAEKVDFVDNNIQAIKLIHKNLEGIEGNFTVNNIDFLEFLKNAKRDNIKYNIIFIDAPFATNYAKIAIDYIISNDLVESKGIIIYEKAYNTAFQFSFEDYSCVQKKYGSVEIVKIIKNQ